MPTIRFENATGTFTYEEAPPIDPPPIEPPPVEPPPEGGDLWQPPSYLRTDDRTEPVPNTPKPPYLVLTTDPTFNTKIIRITGDPGSSIRGISGAKWGNEARHHYSSDQAWNADQSLIYLDTNKGSGGSGAVCLNGSTYEPMFMANSIPSDADVRWSVTDPKLMMYAAGSKLGTWNPKTGAVTVIKNFGNAYSDMKFGPWEGSFSEDGNMVVLSCSRNGKTIGFAYNVKTDEKHPDITKDYDNVRISSKGNYIVWGTSPDHVIITDLAGSMVTDLPNNYVSHFDVITDENGDEVLVGRNNGAGGGQSGLVNKYRLRDGKRTVLGKIGWSYHTSSRAMKTHRWCVSASADEGGSNQPGEAEIFLMNLDGSKAYRLCHHHIPRNIDYVAETQPSHSPDGGRVIFASAWGASGSQPRPVGCYIADFRT